jgi:hypothetical protein
MSKEEVLCAGCMATFLEHELSEDGYCGSCQYEHEQKLDSKTSESEYESIS